MAAFEVDDFVLFLVLLGIGGGLGGLGEEVRRRRCEGRRGVAYLAHD